MRFSRTVVLLAAPTCPFRPLPMPLLMRLFPHAIAGAGAAAEAARRFHRRGRLACIQERAGSTSRCRALRYAAVVCTRRQAFRRNRDELRRKIRAPQFFPLPPPASLAHLPPAHSFPQSSSDSTMPLPPSSWSPPEHRRSPPTRKRASSSSRITCSQRSRPTTPPMSSTARASMRRTAAASARAQCLCTFVRVARRRDERCSRPQPPRTASRLVWSVTRRSTARPVRARALQLSIACVGIKRTN